MLRREEPDRLYIITHRFQMSTINGRVDMYRFS